MRGFYKSIYFKRVVLFYKKCFMRNIKVKGSKRKNRFKLLNVSLFKVVLNDECSSFKNK